VRGEPKIFDFGLAKQLHPEKKLSDGTYKLTGFTGSIKYMAPEVAEMVPYNFSADVYSFGIIFWQILSCDEPYKSYTYNMIENYVIKKGYRPKTNPNWRKPWTDLTISCWDKNPSMRPSFEDVLRSLRQEICDLQGDPDIDNLDIDASMRSRRDI